MCQWSKVPIAYLQVYGAPLDSKVNLLHYRYNTYKIYLLICKSPAPYFVEYSAVHVITHGYNIECTGYRLLITTQQIKR